MNTRRNTRPSLALALLPIILTLGVLGVQLFYYKDFTPHVPLAIGLAITAVIGWFQGYRWKDMEDGSLHVVGIGLQSLGILIVVGMIIGSWIASGTVPLMIYGGLKLLSPAMFLAVAMLMCSVVSVSLGTSWGTVGTVGLALMGIGAGFDVPMYWTAAAVVSGAFFGDKVFAAVGHHQPRACRDRRKPVRPHPQHDADHHPVSNIVKRLGGGKSAVTETKKPLRPRGLRGFESGGEGGIRTLDHLLDRSTP